MSDEGPRTRVRENVTGIVSVLVTGIWLAALFTGQSWWLAALLVGYVVVVPLVAMVFGDEEDRAEWWDDGPGEKHGERTEDDAIDDRADRTDALETLRDRYARGELTDEQFERKLERLLATETIEDADEFTGERERRRERDPER